MKRPYNPNATGDCFKRSYELLVHGIFNGQKITQPFGQLKLVQGIVWHEGTGSHVHGWVEDDLFCYDFVNGKLKEIPKELYYILGKVKTGEGEIFRYTKVEAVKKSLKVGYYYFSDLPCDK